MKLHKTRDGDDKVRDIELGPVVLRTPGSERPIRLGWRDARGAFWALTMTDAEARDLGHALLTAYVPGPCKRCGGQGIERIGDPPVEPDWCADCGGAGIE